MAGYCDNFSMIDGDSSNFSMNDGGDEFKAFPGLKGDDGTTFYPHVSAEGVLSWTNDGGKPNPDPVNIKGTDGTSAYQAAVEAGFSGTEAEFNTYLSGIGNLTDLVDRKAGMLVDTASGAIASFVPDSTIPNLLGVSVAVEPVQDLHGYANPWPAGGGVNLLPPHDRMQSTSGITVTNNGNGTFTLSGTASSLFSLVSRELTVLPAGSYYFSGSVANNQLYLQTAESVNIVEHTSGNSTASAFTLTEDTPVYLRVRVGTGATVNGTIKPMVSRINTTAFAPYENLCPISGWDAVAVQRTGKNLAELNFATTTRTDITFTNNGDGSVGVNGTAGALRTLQLSDGILLPAGSYILNGSSANATLQVRENSSAGTTLATSANNSDASFTLATQTLIVVMGRVPGGNVVNNETMYPMLRLSSDANATYEPYSGNTYTITLGQTVYGGSLDVTNGTMTVDRAMVDMGSLNWYLYTATYPGFFTRLSDLPSSIAAGELTLLSSCYAEIGAMGIGTFFGSDNNAKICRRNNENMIMVQDNRYSTAAEFQTAIAGQQVVYPLATPITITLDPLTISTISGQTNNVWADAGDVSVEFAADLKTYIDQKIAAAVAALS